MEINERFMTISQQQKLYDEITSKNKYSEEDLETLEYSLIKGLSANQINWLMKSNLEVKAFYQVVDAMVVGCPVKGPIHNKWHWSIVEKYIDLFKKKEDISFLENLDNSVSLNNLLHYMDNKENKPLNNEIKSWIKDVGHDTFQEKIENVLEAYNYNYSWDILAGEDNSRNWLFDKIYISLLFEEEPDGELSRDDLIQLYENATFNQILGITRLSEKGYSIRAVMDCNDETLTLLNDVTHAEMTEDQKESINTILNPKKKFTDLEIQMVLMKDMNIKAEAGRIRKKEMER